MSSCRSYVLVLFIVASRVSGQYVDYDQINYSSNVEYLVNLISQTLNSAMTYVLPQDAREHLPAGPQTFHFGKFDYVIVGAGTSGSVVANRLSERKDFSVLVLEAGEFENDFTDIPYYNNPAQFTRYNWGYYTVPQTTSCLAMINRQCPYPRGKGVGGSSIINGLVYARGNPHDFNRWEAAGNPGWSYEDVLPYFKKSEKIKIPSAEKPFHGKRGPLDVEFRSPYSPELFAFLRANQQRGVKILDYNGKDQFGASPVQTFTRNGARVSGGKAFVVPALGRGNLQVLTGSYVTRVLIDAHKKAHGVEFTFKRRKYVVEVNHEVILSAGVVGSAQILQLSGVGPKEFLLPVGIPVIQELAVGKNLRDHATFYGMGFQSSYAEPVRPLTEYVQEYLQGVGPLTIGANMQGIGYYQTGSTVHLHSPDIELVFVPANSSSDLSPRVFNLDNATANALFGGDPTRSFSVYVILMHPVSKGTIRIKSADPFDYPYIDTALLSDPLNRDIDTMYAGVELVLDLMNTKALGTFNPTYAVQPLPGCLQFEYLSREYWYCAIRQLTMYIYHGMGTCKMGPEPSKGAVVDNRLRVHGISNLRVADVSVIPVTVATHPSSVAYLIGEIVSDYIKKDHDGRQSGGFSQGFFGWFNPFK